MDSTTTAQKENADPERPLAAAIDIALIAAIASILTLPARTFGYEHRLAPDLVLIAIAIALYYLLFELLLKATPGKLLVGLRVTTLDGSSPAAWQIVLRNVLRVLDVLPAFYFMGAAAVAATKHRQRIGDLAARTSVRRISVSSRTAAAREYAALACAIVFSGSAVAITLLGLGRVMWMDPSREFVLGSATIAALAVGLLAFLGRNARYGILTCALLVGASSVWIVAWSDRYAVAADHTAEIKSMIEQGIPANAPASEVLSFLESKRIGHSGPDINKYSDRLFFEGDVLRRGDRYIRASVPRASWGFWCSNTLLVYFVLVDNRVDRVIYAEFGDGCP